VRLVVVEVGAVELGGGERELGFVEIRGDSSDQGRNVGFGVEAGLPSGVAAQIAASIAFTVWDDGTYGYGTTLTPDGGWSAF
jgi:hypothetical protein